MSNSPVGKGPKGDKGLTGPVGDTGDEGPLELSTDAGNKIVAGTDSRAFYDPHIFDGAGQAGHVPAPGPATGKILRDNGTFS